MKNLFNLRQLYRPVQPTVKQTELQVYYKEVTPDEKLQHIIYCYWELKTRDRLQTPFTYRVVADGCIDIFFEPGKPEENFVMGFCKKYTEFPLENMFHYVGIRFFPTMFPAVFNIDVQALSNRFEKLEQVAKDPADFIASRVAENDDFETIKETLDVYFIGLMGHINLEHDIRFLHALQIILKNSGVVNVQKDLDVGLSPRQLRRYFEFYVGDTAKTFSQVVRFQNILKVKPSTQSLKQNKVFFDHGYYDQAHFIKEFKNFYGATPSKAFGR